MSDFSVLTVATDNEGYLTTLTHQLKTNNIKCEIVGYGEKWGGWCWRTDKILDALKSHDPSDIVIIIDGYDVIMLGNKEDVLKKYKTFNTDVVFGIESTDSIEKSYAKYIIDIGLCLYFGTNNEYIKNGGSFMGRAESLIEIYERIKKYYKDTGIKDDQTALNNIYLDDIDHKLDINSEIFWIWELRTIYDEIYLFFYDHLPPDISYVKVNDNQVIFNNGIKPEFVHGVCHRDMNILLHTDFHAKIDSREYAGDGINISHVRYLVALIFLIIIVIVFHRIGFKN